MMSPKTSPKTGEIRVHIENGGSKAIEARAKEVFHQLKMDRTKLQNGVLIYVAGGCS